MCIKPQEVKGQTPSEAHGTFLDQYSESTLFDKHGPKMAFDNQTTGSNQSGVKFWVTQLNSSYVLYTDIF